MRKIFFQEIKRYYKLYIISIFVYIIIALMAFPNISDGSIRNQHNTALIFIVCVSLYFLVEYLKDEFSNNKLLYMKAKISPFKKVVGKLLVNVFFTILTMIIAMIIINLRVAIIRYNHPIRFLTMRMDYLGLIVFDKSIRELYYPVNLILNILLNVVFIIQIFILYKIRLRKKGNNVFTFFESITISVILYLLTKMIVKYVYFRPLDFNFINQRVKAMELSVLEINFLNLVCVLVYLCYFVLLMIFIIKDKGDDSL